MEEKKTRKKKLKGVVVSNKMTGTIKVEVSFPFRHPRYKKVMNKRKSYFARADNKKYSVGDAVVIRESRPYSKNVKWVVVENGTEGK